MTTKKKKTTQLSVTSVTFFRQWPLITFLLLCNAASKPLFSFCSLLTANCYFRCFPLSASDLWGKCSPLCLLHLVGFVLKISILWQLPKAFTFCIPIHHVEYKQGTIPYLNGRSGCTPNVQLSKRQSLEQFRIRFPASEDTLRLAVVVPLSACDQYI